MEISATYTKYVSIGRRRSVLLPHLIDDDGSDAVVALISKQMTTICDGKTLEESLDIYTALIIRHTINQTSLSKSFLIDTHQSMDILFFFFGVVVIAFINIMGWTHA